MANVTDTAREIYTTGLRNQHALAQSLRQEQAMAKWVRAQVGPTTLTGPGRSAAGRTVGI